MIDKISELKLSDFIKCAVNGEYSVLVLYGTPTEEQLQECWLNILSQYYDATGNHQMSQFVKKKWKAEKLQARLNRIGMNLDAIKMALSLKDDYTEQIALLIAELKADGHKHPFTPETMEKDLLRVETIEKGNLYDLNKLIKELESYEHKGGDKLTEDAFINSLLDISEFNKIDYNAETITVQKYCLLVKRLEKHIEYLKTKQDGI